MSKQGTIYWSFLRIYEYEMCRQGSIITRTKFFPYGTRIVVPFASTREFITTNTIATHLSCFCMINGVKYIFLDKIRYREIC